MADNSLDILIRILSERVGGEEAKKILQEVAEETRKGAQTSSDANKVIQEGTEKAFASKKNLKDMVKQLGHEFPLLGQLGRFALNPIAATTAGITAAFVIWNAKIKEVQSTYASFELPNLSPPDPSKINASAKAWEDYGKAISKIREDMNSVESMSARALAQITATSALLKRMREDEAKRSATGQAAGGPGADAFFEREAARATYQTETAAAAALLKRGQEKADKASGIRINSPEEEKKNLEDLKAQAAAAEEGKKEELARLQDIKDATDPNITGRSAIWPSLKVIARQAANMASTQTLADIANANIDSADAVINRYNSRVAEQADRDLKRKEREEGFSGAAADIAKANQMAEEADRKWRDANVRYGYEIKQAGLPVISTPNAAGGTVTPGAADELRRIEALREGLTKEFVAWATAWTQALKKAAPPEVPSTGASVMKTAGATN